jgi:Stress up-regulated Nod 19
MDPAGLQINQPISGFCSNCTVSWGKAMLYSDDGRRATVDEDVYEHHVVIMDMSKQRGGGMPFYFCKGQVGLLGNVPASGFIISGNDEAKNMFTPHNGTQFFKSGYKLGARSQQFLQAELINYKHTDQKVYIVLEYEYTQHATDPKRTESGAGIADTAVSLFSVTGCQAPDYQRDPTKTQYETKIEPVPIPMDGWILNSKGHLHDGGDRIELLLNGKVICDSHAVYGKRKTTDSGQAWEVITEMEQCPTPIRVKKGDLLSMKSYYDVVKHPARHTHSSTKGDDMADEMGVFFLNFAGSNQTTGMWVSG